MDEARAPWWARRGARLAVLLSVLAGVAAYGVPRIIREVSGPPVAPQCPPVVAGLARTARPNPGSIWFTVDGGTIIGDGKLRWSGMAQPGSAWSDYVDPHDPTAGHGYSFIWWSRADDLLSVSVFAFATARDAHAYVARAASTQCRSFADPFRMSRPLVGRGLVWQNPDNNLQADVLFVRGTEAFYVTEVRPRDARSVPRRVAAPRLLATAEAVACRLPPAGCG